ncbi:MAG: DUF4363 family protein [Clostridia bacterium]|nr:DUF4363 family protein [Clostridia bacterium]
MRRVITAFVMLAVTVIGIAVISIVLKEKLEETDKNILYLYENIDRLSVTEIKEELNSLNDEWNKTEKLLNFVTVHSKTEPVSENIRILCETSEISDKYELKMLCIKIKLQLEMLYESEKPLAENIF